MDIHLYFSLIPEALIASNLPPEKFGQYYATGSNYKSRGQCVFFEVDTSFRNDYFDIPTAFERCVPAADGSPKHSVYVSVYRVLEHLPIAALGKLYLTTAYGHTLGIERGQMAADEAPCLHLYQDLAPVNSLVVSALDPLAFYRSVTVEATKFVRFPGLVFVELALDELATDPENGQAASLPYPFIHHLREALMVLQPGGKESKMVHRVHSLEFPYRMVKHGFHVGNGNDLAFYPMPDHRVIRERNKEWWRSANV
jgi:hypothetical protein